MQITEQIIERIARKTFNSMFAPALRQSNVVTSGAGSSVNWADNAGHANSADSLTDLSQIENMLANYVTTSALSTTLADYVTASALQTTLADYATKTYVDQNYLSLSFFNALFQARTSQGAVVAPNSGDTTTIDNIKAMFGFWTDQYISALGQGSDGGGATTTLAQLNDVQLSLPLDDGEALVYSSTLGKWTNSAAIAPAWGNITGKPTTIAGYGITDAHITNGVITLGANSITPITSLTGYATESWVNTQLADYVTTTALGTTLADYVTTTALGTTLADYATKTYVDQNYLSLAFFNALFQARTSQGAVVAPNSGDTTTIDNIKALFGFWTDQYISALGQGSDGGAVTSLAALADVSLSTPIADGEVLKYSTTLGKWTNGTASMVGALNDLSDVTITSVADKDILQYDYTSSKWVNTTISTALSGYATTSQLANYLPVSGGTLTGNLLVSADKGANIGSSSARFYYGYLYRVMGLQSIENSTDGTCRLTLPSKTGTLAVVGDIPTNNNQLTNGAGYITGITSSMVTTALGYTPANSSSLSSYLPLSGGTITNTTRNSLTLNNTTNNTEKGAYIAFDINGNTGGYVGYYDNGTLSFCWLGAQSQRLFLDASGGARIGTDSNSYVVYHTGNLSPITTTNWSSYIGTSSSYVGYASYATSAGSATTAGTATYAGQLSTARSLWGNSFNGTGDINGCISIRGTGSNFNDGLRIHMASNGFCGVVLCDSTNTGDSGTSANTWSMYNYNGTFGFSKNDSIYTDNDSCLCCNSSKNWGIGTNSPTMKLDVRGQLRIFNSAYNEDIAHFVVYETNPWGIVFGCVNPSNGAFKIQVKRENTAGEYMPLILNYDGANVGVGSITSPSYKLHVAGDVYATGGVTSLSDIRKKDVLSYDLPLTIEQVAEAPTIKFLWKDKREMGEQVGTVAQYWQKVLPEVTKDKSNELSMSYGVTALIAAITTARTVVDHEKRITELERECADWREAYNALRMDYEQLKLKIA